MMADRITERTGVQTPDVNDWRRSLRSPSPNGQRSCQSLSSRTPSPSRSKGPREKRSLRSRSPSPNAGFTGAHITGVPTTSAMKKNTVANGLRHSMGSSLTADLSMSGRLKKSTLNLGQIESEYIKNLQKQIYFLELEASYLREQTTKATEIHPQMTQEAERMLTKLRQMQSELDKQELELKRMDSSIGIHTAEKLKLQEQVKSASGTHQREKRILMDEVMTMKKEKGRLDRQLVVKEEQLSELKTTVDKASLAVKNAELKNSTLRAQLEQRIEQHNMTQLALEEKRSELVSTVTQLKETEERHYASTVNIQDKLTEDLRDEIRKLHQRVKESELALETERYLHDKVSDNMALTLQESAGLKQEVLELSRQLDREKELRTSTNERHSNSVSEVVSLRDKGSSLMHENDQLRGQLRHEQDKCGQYLDQLTSEEMHSKTMKLQSNSVQARMSELEGMKSAVEGENIQLRKDKTLLVEHVAELQQKMDDKDQEVLMLKSSVNDRDTRFRNLDIQKRMDLTQQGQRWEEFSRLADSMKSLSQSMMSQTTLENSPRTAVANSPGASPQY